MAETPQDRSLAASLEQHRSPGTAMVTGLFRDRASAERAWEAASRRGYDREHVNVVMSDATRKRHFSGDDAVQTELGSKAAEGAGIGAGIGGTLGAIAGVVAAVGTSIALPGLGLVIAGPLAAGLAGAGAGGVTGGLLGALIGAGIPEERVKHYEQGIHEGGILMGVAPRSDEDARELERSWRDSNGEHVLGTGLGAGGGAVGGAVIGAPAGPLGMAAGAAIGAVAGGMAGKATAETASQSQAAPAAATPAAAGADETRTRHTEQTIATGVATTMGALVGAALGGPPGMAAGAAIGGLAGAGAAMGKGQDAVAHPVADAPSASSPGMPMHYGEEEAYWRRAFEGEPYRLGEYRYEDYAPAYHLGYTTFGRYGTRFEEAESRLAGEWDVARGASRLSWQQAMPAVRAAWDKLGGRRA